MQIVLTDRISEVSGTVKASGQPVSAASVVLFPDDPAQWAFPSRRVRMVRVDQSGVFRARSLPPSGYLALAVDYLEQGEFQDPCSWNGCAAARRPSHSATARTRTSS